MICPRCSEKTHVTNSRPRTTISETWRRRSCSTCGATFTTIEQLQCDEFTYITTTSGKQALFSISTLAASINGAFGHNTDLGQTAALWIARTIEARLITPHTNNKKVLSTTYIARATHTTLRNFDKQAAQQYLGKYYRHFNES